MREHAVHAWAPLELADGELRHAVERIVPTWDGLQSADERLLVVPAWTGFGSGRVVPADVGADSDVPAWVSPWRWRGVPDATRSDYAARRAEDAVG